jgi:hypothetical protein
MGFGSALGTGLGFHLANKIAGKGNSAKISAEADKEMQSERLAAEKEMAAKEAKRAEKEAKRNDLESIVNIKFGDTSDDIANTLNVLFATVAQLPKGIAAFADTDAKTKKKAIIEKLEFGLLKLNKVDHETGAFFQRKFDELTAKKK